MALKIKFARKSPNRLITCLNDIQKIYVSVFLLIDLTAKVIYHLRFVLLLIRACGKIVCIGNEFLLSLLRSSLLGGN